MYVVVGFNFNEATDGLELTGGVLLRLHFFCGVARGQASKVGYMFKQGGKDGNKVRGVLKCDAMAAAES